MSEKLVGGRKGNQNTGSRSLEILRSLEMGGGGRASSEQSGGRAGQAIKMPWALGDKERNPGKDWLVRGWEGGPGGSWTHEPE